MFDFRDYLARFGNQCLAVSCIVQMNIAHKTEISINKNSEIRLLPFARGHRRDWQRGSRNDSRKGRKNIKFDESLLRTANTHTNLAFLFTFSWFIYSCIFFLFSSCSLPNEPILSLSLSCEICAPIITYAPLVSPRAHFHYA